MFMLAEAAGCEAQAGLRFGKRQSPTREDQEIAQAGNNSHGCRRSNLPQACMLLSPLSMIHRAQDMSHAKCCQLRLEC